MIFKQKKRTLVHKINIKLNRKSLYPTTSVKCLIVKFDENLNWHHHINDPEAKLNGANSILFKIRNCVNQKVLSSIYFAIFDSHLNYASLIWAPDSNAIQQLVILQEKSHQNKIISALNLSFFQKNNILKFSDKTMIDNILFISKALNNMLPPIFKNWFQFCYNIPHYSTTSFVKDHLHKKSFRTNNFGKFSVTVSAIDSWNARSDG